MATVAISALPATNTVDATTVAPVVYSGSTYKATLTTLGAYINTNAVTVSASGNITGGNIRTGGLISASGNITGGNILGGANVNATTHTGTTVSVTGNITGGNILGGANVNATTHTGTTVSVTGNITGGNINVPAGNIEVVNFINTGALIATGRVDAGTTMSAAGNITGGNLITSAAVSAASVSASGNITGGNLITSAAVSAASVSASGNITGGNLITSAAVSATSVSASGNITGGNILGGANVNATTHTGATVSVTGNVTAGNLNAAGLSLSSNVVSALNVTGNIAGGNVSGSSLTGNVVSVSGNITGGNLIGTLITSAFSTAGNVTGGNLVTSGAVSAASVSASGNITAANMNVATGNITGGNISLSGNTTPGNVLTGGIVSATGNVTGGNIIGTTAVVVPTVRNTAALTISTSAGDLNLQPTGNVVVNSKYINGVTDPVQDQDVATKKYVDNFATTGIAYHAPVTVATTTDLATTTGGTVTYTQPNGVGNGIGALLTTTGSFNLIDTANVQSVGTRILVKNQGNAAQNGVYTWANATNIVRSTDADEYGADSTTALSINDYFYTTGGNVNLGTAFIVNAPTGTITFGTSNITFSTFSSSQIYTANTAAGISLNGTVINAKVDGVTTAFDGSGNISVKASANLTTPNIGAATGTSLSTTGNITAGNLNTAGLSLSSNVISALNSTSNITTTANISGGNLITAGAVSAASVSASGNITGGNILTGGLISSTGNVTGGNIITGAAVSAASVSASGNITGGNILGGANVNATTHTGTTVSVSGNITGGNIITGGALSAGSLSLSGASQAASYSASGNVTGGNLITGAAVSAASVSASGNVTGGNLITGAAVSAASVSASGNVTGGNLTVSTGTVTLGNIVNANGNGVGNIGSSSVYFNTVFAKATSAQYADLAEKYTADAEYTSGAVLSFGGAQEVTITLTDADHRVAGVVSANPATIMNAGLTGEHVATVALTGRVPCSVTGTVRKGDSMVSAGNGVARAEANPAVSTVIGKALEDFDGESGVIEIVVGRV